ncbi:hypothetical protein TRFO_31805 [Tritrichomonas foetus]|uniref:Uncharacterized protein n=1 Tax=Tritrichomonas foetus TaxID=1144522 RepID=A0A1J4JQV4_9EUKA|nr:hypothetical protein TRFO_31805 [Tritrichomonas foetus]|eukprot:OHT01419.1 hypothetical protein TRFO_31805 [Tritrichomonas foetus]
MLSFFVSFAFSSIPSLSLDDTYHEVLLTNQSNATYWVQPLPKKAAIIVIYDEDTIKGFKKTQDMNDFSLMTPSVVKRSNGFREFRYIFTEEDPLQFLLSCDTICDFVINYVHTEPVYRVSVVLGVFTFFVSLILLVFGWTLFCGGCRATKRR